MKSINTRLAMFTLVMLLVLGGIGLQSGTDAQSLELLVLTQIPGGTLDATAVPKYQMPLVKPPAMPREGKIKYRGMKNAEYYEIARMEKGRWKLDQPHPSHIRTLEEQRDRVLPIKDLIFRNEDGFYEDPEINYAQSWAFIRFLRHTTQENRQIFEDLFNALQEKIPARKAVDRVFAGVDLGKLQKEYDAYLDTIG